MKMDIVIVVDVPQMVTEQRLQFIEGVMDTFRKTFPEAQEIPRKDINDPSPVTVTIHTEGERTVCNAKPLPHTRSTQMVGVEARIRNGNALTLIFGHRSFWGRGKGCRRVKIKSPAQSSRRSGFFLLHDLVYRFVWGRGRIKFSRRIYICKGFSLLEFDHAN